MHSSEAALADGWQAALAAAFLQHFAEWASVICTLNFARARPLTQ